MITPMDAVLSLRPGAQCVVQGMAVEFHDDSAPLTPQQIEAEMARLEQAAADDANAKAAARDAALAKLAALGLTVDDLSALGF